MSMSRRSFIKIGGAAFGAAALGAGLGLRAGSREAHATSDPGTDGDLVVPTFCELCFWKCGVLAHVKDGRVTKIVGNPDHPFSQGRLCPRGTGGIGLLYDPDRLKTPLVRRAFRGGEDFEEVSWERALDHVAERLMAVKKLHGPESLALFAHGFGGSWFSRLVQAYGTAAIAAPSYAQCRGSREAAFQLTFGAPVGSPEVLDLEHSRVITLIGSHLGENMHNTQVQELATALGNGAELVVVDPRFSTAAGKARYWLPIKPGTDLALLLAWAHVMVDEGLYDRDYVDAYAVGLDRLREHLKDKTPEWAAVETGLAPGLIAETARFIAGARPASLIHPGRHTNWHGNDTQRGRAIAILNALLGSWGRRGGFYLPTQMKLPPLPGLPKLPKALRAPPDTPRGTSYPFADEVLAHGLRDASLPGADVEYPIKAWMVYGTNLVQALPQQEKTIRALQALDFVVAIDVLPAEITGWADVVLPEATYLERYDDIYAPQYKEAFLALRQPVVPPLHASRPGWWIARELAQRMELGQHFPEGDIERYLEARLHAAGTSLAAIKKTGVIHGPKDPVFIEDGVLPTFKTPSGKIELFSQQLADAGQAPLPEHTRPEPTPAGFFRLLFGRMPTNTFGRTTNNRFLARSADGTAIWVNAGRATELGLADGDPVFVVNQDGARIGPLAIRATQAIRPDCVWMVHGFGHSARGLSFAKGRGGDDAALITRTVADPVMGGSGMTVNFVRLEREVA
ncbi:MAG: molybdopterin-dependent oxidoreductase [Myxococcota bacterium]